MNLFVSLVDFDIQPPVVGHLLNSGIKDVTDLRIRWRKVTLVDFGVFPHPFADTTTTDPRLTGTEAGDIGLKFVLHRKEFGLRDVKRRCYRHPLPSLVHRLR